MARKGNRQLYKVVNKKTGSFYITEGNKINEVPKTKKKFDKKTGKHEEFTVQKMK